MIRCISQSVQCVFVQSLGTRSSCFVGLANTYPAVGARVIAVRPAMIRIVVHAPGSSGIEAPALRHVVVACSRHVKLYCFLRSNLVLFKVLEDMPVAFK